MEDPTTEKIDRYIEEFFPMRKGEMIYNPAEEILLAENIKIRRMGLKHIVESRREDGYSLEEIKNMMSRVIETMLSPGLDIANTNNKYPNSRIVGKLHLHEGRALLVIYQRDKKIKVVYNLYYREINRFKKMK